jgi:diguanylate cyclase (GGDEF)-like protein
MLLVLCIAAAFLAPSAAFAQEAGQKLVRVGWFDSSFCYWDQFGRRCGVAYEYQQKISAYTDWTYEYIEDSWPNLLQKLMAGEIDLLSDVSYKPERTEFMSFPDIPMGTETYYIYVSARNRDIMANNLKSFNGKRIGVNQGSVQEGFLRDWAEKNQLTIEIVPLTTEQDVSMDMLAKGTLDGFADIYSFSSEQKVTPICRIGGSDYFFAVNKAREDLLAELNMALASIQDEDPYFIEQLNEERQYSTRTNASLTPDQTDWLDEHGTVRVGYVENYLPFSQTDQETGELTGALKDFLSHAENSLRTTNIRFETIPFLTTAAALEALKAGEIDCVFPVNVSTYDAEQEGIRLTNPAMKTGVNVVMRENDDRNLSRDSELMFAISQGNPNLDTFIKEQYPACRVLIFANEDACYDAVSNATADCMLISNYRVPAEEARIQEHKLFHVPTGEHIPFSFAVRRGDKQLYFLMNKAVITTKSEDMDSALASYMHTSRKVTFTDFLKDHWIAVLVALTAVFAVIVTLLLLHMKAQRKAHEQEKLLAEAAEIAALKNTITSLLDNIPGRSFTKDAKTGVYLACNQAFADFAHKKDPSGVIGRTDAELFDTETARRYVEDDKMALSMDEPYIFFEDMPDASGETRQMKITKRKYIDATGRECVLGVSQDVTDSYRIRRMQAATKESYEKARGAGAIYTHLAQALARGYAGLYYIDLNTEEFIEYRPDAETGGLTEMRRGWHFFEQCLDEADQFVYSEDRETLKKALDRKTLIRELDKDGTFFMTYRMAGKEGPHYVSMKVTRMQDDDRYIVLGITDIDEQVKQRNAAMREQEEQIAYNRLKALAGEFICIYVVDPDTGRYREFTSTADYQTAFAQAESGADFFATTREASRKFTYPEDLNRFLAVFTKENVMADIESSGIFAVSYRLMIDGIPRYVRLKAGLVEEKEGRRLIVGINDIDSQVRQEEDYVDRLARARIKTSVDALTGVKNRHAYLDAIERLDDQDAEGENREYAVTILDVNDLKRVNDTEGHKAGDRYLQDACKFICKVFKHSPVFRIGGDEFAVISQGDDYDNIDGLISRMAELNEEAIRDGGIIIACGMARREGDATAAEVVERADLQMYDNKSELKRRAGG